MAGKGERGEGKRGDGRPSGAVVQRVWMGRARQQRGRAIGMALATPPKDQEGRRPRQKNSPEQS
eukprot:9920002-Alexandrium_andersonii.AAC.1